MNGVTSKTRMTIVMLMLVGTCVYLCSDGIVDSAIPIAPKVAARIDPVRSQYSRAYCKMTMGTPPAGAPVGWTARRPETGVRERLAEPGRAWGYCSLRRTGG